MCALLKGNFNGQCCAYRFSQVSFWCEPFFDQRRGMINLADDEAHLLDLRIAILPTVPDVEAREIEDKVSTARRILKIALEHLW